MEFNEIDWRSFLKLQVQQLPCRYELKNCHGIDNVRRHSNSNFALVGFQSA